ncbi:hypothetical protein RNZ50_20070 [Paracoccaceae bacterium Fryx2]|nr:hypothetical protein [Paracoccaceae bacterium Fryx2]
MNERCTYHRTEYKVTRANAFRPGAREVAPQRIAVPFCAHPTQSPAPRGSGKPLTCGGLVPKCLIPGGPDAI